MAAIEAGKQAPDFSWPAIDGSTYWLADALKTGPVLVAFFKVGCPTCQYTLPFLERAASHFGRVWGVSQDNDRATRDFAKHFGISFPLLLEDTDDYPTSDAYGLTHVPSIFLIGQDGKILTTCVGFAKQDLQEMMSKLESLTAKQGFQLFQAGEDVPKFKSG